ncbi:LysR family transcriptional regulator [Marinobacterium sp. D7]|uniref:LysR family transcriptional regulator n=1 Tax=Marinobacterium ramblicola TaxID=2849041 RepID=UPI001C2D8A78|nr:LysR substrate-binding domain-containing protein [Marinobacterium ramblicola]MBV1786541.1 LysR family transcriptional regulator [Marinobacterium ramblicola]
MDIDLLRAYIAVVDTGSLTRAARRTHRTQAALSMQMKRLEEQSGCTLFFKEGRSLELTHEGKQLVSYARRLLALHDEALNQLRTDSALPPLRIGSPDDYAQHLLPLVAEAIQARHPDLQLQLTCAPTSKLRPLLDDGALDLAILTRAVDNDEGHLLMHDRGIWIQHPQFDPLQHTGLPLVLYEADCKFHSSALDGLNKAHRTYRIKALSSNAGALMALVRQGQAITAAASASLPTDLVEVDTALDLPPLPAIDIVLVSSVTGHPLLSANWAGELARQVATRIESRR